MKSLLFILGLCLIILPVVASLSEKEVGQSYIIWNTPGEPFVIVDGSNITLNESFIGLYGLAPNTTHSISNSTNTLFSTTLGIEDWWLAPWLILAFIYLMVLLGSRIPLVLLFPILMTSYMITTFDLASHAYLTVGYFFTYVAAFVAWRGSGR